MKKRITFGVLIILLLVLLTSCAGVTDYKFLKGTWQNKDWPTQTDIWFNDDITKFKYVFKNEFTNFEEIWEGDVEKTKNEETNQINIKLVIDETSSFSFVVKSDNSGKTYLENRSGEKFYKI